MSMTVEPRTEVRRLLDVMCDGCCWCAVQRRRVPFARVHEAAQSLYSPDWPCFMPGQRISVEIFSVERSSEHLQLLSPNLYAPIYYCITACSSHCTVGTALAHYNCLSGASWHVTEGVMTVSSLACMRYSVSDSQGSRIRSVRILFSERYVRTLTYSILAYVNKNRIRTQTMIAEATNWFFGTVLINLLSDCVVQNGQFN